MDHNKVTEFLGQFVTDMGATGAAGSVAIGHRLGLYRALAGGPATPEQFAERTGCHPRYLTEWLRGQAAGGYVSYDPATGEFWLTEEQAFCLADPNGPNVPAAFIAAPGYLRAEPRIAEAFRTGAGVGWHEHHEDVFVGCDAFYRPGYVAELVPNWIPALEENTIRIGQRRRAARWATAAATGLAVVVGAGAVMQIAPWSEPDGGDRTATRPAGDCTVEPLIQPDGFTSAAVTGIDPTGRYLIGHVGSPNGVDAPSRTVLWTDGRPQLLPEDASGAEAVNASGVVVGTYSSGGAGHAWIYRDGRVSKLPVPAGGEAGRVAINARGDVAGLLHRDGGTAAIVWPADGSDAYRIMESPRRPVVRGITDSGVVVGGIENGAPYRWEPDTSGRELAILPGLTTGWVIDVAGNWAVGFLEARPAASAPPAGVRPPGSSAAVRWNLATGEVTATGDEALPAAIDASGRVLQPENPPRLVEPNGMTRALPMLPGYTRAIAQGISNNGIVAGWVATNDKNPAVPYRTLPARWICPL